MSCGNDEMWKYFKDSIQNIILPLQCLTPVKTIPACTVNAVSSQNPDPLNVNAKTITMVIRVRVSKHWSARIKQ